MSTLTLQHTVTIHKPPEEVFRYLADEYFLHRKERTPLNAEIVESVQTSPGPVGLGTTGRELVRDKLGRYSETQWSVTEYSPYSSFAVQGVSRFALEQPEAKVEIPDPNAETRHNNRIDLSPDRRGTRARFQQQLEYDDSKMTSRQKMWLPLWKMQREEQYRMAIYRLNGTLENKPRIPILQKLAILGSFWLSLWGAIAAVFLLLFWLYVSQDTLEFDRSTTSSIQTWLIVVCVAFMVTVTLRLIVRPRER